MDTSIVLARIIGVYLIVIAIALLVRRKDIGEVVENYISHPGGMFLGGLIALFVGSGIVAVHNVWALDWRLVITLFGWLALIKAFFIVVLPGQYRFMAKTVKNETTAMAIGALMLLLGLWMTYIGYY